MDQPSPERQAMYAVRVMRPVAHDGTYFAKGKTFLADKSTAEKHKESGHVEILGVATVTPVDGKPS